VPKFEPSDTARIQLSVRQPDPAWLGTLARRLDVLQHPLKLSPPAAILGSDA
jgi:hypothetical protein